MVVGGGVEARRHWERVGDMCLGEVAWLGQLNCFQGTGQRAMNFVQAANVFTLSWLILYEGKI
jgi:hypothetical protein